MKNPDELIKRRPIIGRVLGNTRHTRKQLCRISPHDRLDHIQHAAPIDSTEHVSDIGLDQLSRTEGNGLVGQTQGITHRAFGTSR